MRVESSSMTILISFLGSGDFPWQYQRERSLSLSVTVDALTTVSALALTSSAGIVAHLSYVTMYVQLAASTRVHK